VRCWGRASRPWPRWRPAVDVLSKNPNGYFLLVEGGKIDMGSHLGNAKRTLSETVEFSKAIAAVLAKVDLKDTLVVVTADHSHGLVISGYAARNAPILGLAGNEGEPILAGDGKAYTTLMFATGPGGPEGNEPARIRPRKTPTTSTTTSRPRSTWAAPPTRARTWACSPTARRPSCCAAWSRRATSSRSCATPSASTPRRRRLRPPPRPAAKKKRFW
jgi:hypothetical protein